MLFIDANIFLAYDNARDVHHARALSLAQEISAGVYGQAFTTDYVLNEVVGVTFRKLGKERALRLGNQMLKSISILNIDEHMMREAWKLFQTAPLRLNFVDCTNLIALRAVETHRIATLDAEFKKMNGLQVIS